jgi:hypothetical protein
MAKNTKADLQKIPSSFIVLFFCLFFTIPNSTYAYFDQVIIEMPKATKTIYDIRVHGYLRFLYEQGLQIDPTDRRLVKSFFDDELTKFYQAVSGSKLCQRKWTQYQAIKR